jgi:hypothetical protein
MRYEYDMNRRQSGLKSQCCRDRQMVMWRAEVGQGRGVAMVGLFWPNGGGSGLAES